MHQAKGCVHASPRAERYQYLAIWRVYLITAAAAAPRAELDIYGPSGQYFKYKQGDIPFYLMPKEFQRPTVVNEKSGIRPLLCYIYKYTSEF